MVPKTANQQGKTYPGGEQNQGTNEEQTTSATGGNKKISKAKGSQKSQRSSSPI